MSREEFLRRWEQIPELKHAELIKGVVYLASQVSIAHGSYYTLLGGLLRNYARLSKYLEQVPELVVEISYSSQSYDLGPKFAAYQFGRLARILQSPAATH